jgi:hypothetical protein
VDRSNPAVISSLFAATMSVSVSSACRTSGCWKPSWRTPFRFLRRRFGDRDHDGRSSQKVRKKDDPVFIGAEFPPPGIGAAWSERRISHEIAYFRRLPQSAACVTATTAS